MAKQRKTPTIPGARRCACGKFALSDVLAGENECHEVHTAESCRVDDELARALSNISFTAKSCRSGTRGDHDIGILSGALHMARIATNDQTIPQEARAKFRAIAHLIEEACS